MNTMTLTPPLRLLFLSEDPHAIKRQLAGERLSVEQARPLRDDVSTDEITPVHILSHYDDTLGDFAHTGLSCAGVNPVAKRGLRTSGLNVLVAGRRYGKGSSREHSPTAEKLAGVQLVIAESFERIYRQNADNIGLFTSTDLSLIARIERGETLSVDELVADREPLAAAILRAGGLLRWGQQHLRPTTTAPGWTRSDGLHNPKRLQTAHTESANSTSERTPQTLFEKILHRHLRPTAFTPARPQAGDGLFVQADWRFIHEYYTGMAHTLMHNALGQDVALIDPARVVVFEDHTSYVHESPAHLKAGLIPNMLAMSQAQRNFVQHHGLRMHRTLTDEEALHDTQQQPAGISHAMMAEHYALPGQVVVGTDSHTPHSGALGCVAFGVGTSDMANAFLTGAVRVTWPSSIKVTLAGKWPAGVTAKDAVLHLLSLPFIREGGGVGKVFEFTGDGVRALSIDERATLTNMTAELGGLTGIVAPDTETVRFLSERRGVSFQLEDWMQSDPHASYAHHLVIPLSNLSPMVARPGDPGQGVALSDLQDHVLIDIAYGGSCTAGKQEDFDQYHAVLSWGLSQGLQFPDHVQVYLQYGTTAVRDYCIAQGYDKTFAALNVRILQPSCGACANCGPGSSTSAQQVTVSAINRNFPGRSGPGQVWLASPPTVMASALAGELMSWENLQKRKAEKS